MAADIDPAVEATLTPLQQETLKFGLVLSGIRAQQALGEFGSALGLADGDREQLIGRLAVSIEDSRLDTIQRLELTTHLLRSAALLRGLGSEALKDTGVPAYVAPAPPPVADLLHLLNGGGENGAASTGAQAIPETEQPAGEPGPTALDTDEAGQDQNEQPSQPEPVVESLSVSQRGWLTTILGEENVISIETLPVSRRMEFAAKVGEIYCELRIPRTNPTSRKKLSEQMTAFMGGNSFAEIADSFKSTPSAVEQSLRRMKKTISNRIPRADLLSLIPQKDQPQPEAEQAPVKGEEAIESVELTADQQKWLRKVFDPDSVEQLKAYTVVQREVMAELLSRQLRSFILRKEGKVRTDRRVAQMTLFLQGKSYEEIAAEIDQPIDVVKSDLHKSANNLKRGLKALDIKRVFGLALSGQIEPTV